MQEQLKFFKIALLDRKIGAMTRSSKYVVNAVVRNLGHQSLHRVIEYGPGDGVVTKEILNRMPKDGELIVVETNPKFLRILRNIKDSRLKIIEGTAQEISKKFTQICQQKHQVLLETTTNKVYSKGKKIFAEVTEKGVNKKFKEYLDQNVKKDDEKK